MMEANQLIEMFNKEKNSSDRGNFNDLVQSAAEWCNPKADNIEQITSAGSRKSSQRLIDIGIKSNRMFTAGIMSHMFPQGQNWIRVVTADKELMQNDNVTRALSSVTAKFSSDIEESNFYQEMGQCVSHLGYAGTTALYSESTKKEDLVFKSHYYNEFYFLENYEGKMDTFIREFKLTARQAEQQFGKETPAQIKEVAGNTSTASQQFDFIQVVMPRNKDNGYKNGSKNPKELKFADYYVCVTTTDIVKEGGYEDMPYSVGRFYKTNYEKLGRSPAMEVGSTLPMINRMEGSRIRGAERLSNPPWLAPNDGSVRRISNGSGSIIYYNAANPYSKPEQLKPSDNVIVNDEMITKKEMEIQDAFFIPLFNPLLNKKNMTATEARDRIDMSQQFLSPAVNGLTKYFVKPTLDHAFQIQLRAGAYPELDIPELDKAVMTFELVGKASLATRQIELYGTMTAWEQTMMFAEADPAVFDNWNFDKTIRLLQEVNMVPVSLQASEDEIKVKRSDRQQQMQQQQQQEAMTAASSAYAQTSKTPEEGSGAEAMQEAVQEQV